MIRKIIGAVSLFVTFIVTFAIGVGCIIRGAGDFSWDIVSEYVSMSDIVMINDTPISNLFSFSDHSRTVGSQAEGQIAAPTADGVIIIENLPADLKLIASEDEFIHFRFKGNVRSSCVVKSAKNLTGKNIPDIEFDYNDSTDQAIIRFRKLRADAKDMPEIVIAVPTHYAGNMKLDDVAGKLEGEFPLSLSKVTITNIAGKVILTGIESPVLDISEVAGTVEFSESNLADLTIKNSAGKIKVSGTVGVFHIKNIAGSAEVETDRNIAADCEIADIMGKVDVTLPAGSKVKIEKNNVVGIVIAKNSKKGEHTIVIKDVMGKVGVSETS